MFSKINKFFSIFSKPTLKPCSKGKLSLMDPIQSKNIQAMIRYKRREFLDNLYFYSLTALTCSLFYCVTLCLPYLSSMIKVFFFVYISSLIAFLFNSKLLFIISNLIIFALIVNSRILSSHSSSVTNVYYDEYIHSSQTQKPQIPSHEVKAKKLEKHVTKNMVMIREDGLNSLELKDKMWVKKATEAWPDKEEDEGDEPNLFQLNKRADDFIARVNRQRRLELSLLQYGTHFGLDLMHRNAEVKDIITDVISNMSGEEDGEEAENDGDDA